MARRLVRPRGPGDGRPLDPPGAPAEAPGGIRELAGRIDLS
jgi:hypothetical protein